MEKIDKNREKGKDIKIGKNGKIGKLIGKKIRTNRKNNPNHSLSLSSLS